MTQTLLHSGKRLAQYQCFVLIVLGIRFVCFSMLAFRDPQKDFFGAVQRRGRESMRRRACSCCVAVWLCQLTSRFLSLFVFWFRIRTFHSNSSMCGLFAIVQFYCFIALMNHFGSSKSQYRPAEFTQYAPPRLINTLHKHKAS